VVGGLRDLSRRAALRLLASGAVALVAACQSIERSSPTTVPSAAPKPSDQPRSGGILRQGNLGDLPTLDGNF
jgi:hypothetical protein